MAAAKGPLHMIRGTGEQEKMLKNAKTEYWNEFEEIPASERRRKGGRKKSSSRSRSGS